MATTIQDVYHWWTVEGLGPLQHIYNNDMLWLPVLDRCGGVGWTAVTSFSDNYHRMGQLNMWSMVLF